MVCILQGGKEDGWFLNEEVIKLIGHISKKLVEGWFKKQMRLFKMQTMVVGQINLIV